MKEIDFAISQNVVAKVYFSEPKNYNQVTSNQEIQAVGGTRNYCVWYHIIAEKHFPETLLGQGKLLDFCS